MWQVALAQEELGMLGSGALAAKLKQAGQDLKLMVSLEMLAFTGEKQSNPIQPCASCTAIEALPVPWAGRNVPDVRLCGHRPFWDGGYNALMVTDNSIPSKLALPTDERINRHPGSAVFCLSV